MFTNAIIGFLEDINSLVAGLGESSGLLKDLSEWNGSIYNYTQVINNNVVKPIAYVLLAIFFLMEIYNVAQKVSMHGGGNAYTVQQIVFAFIKLILCKMAFEASFVLMSSIYKLFHEIIAGIATHLGSGTGTSGLDVESLTAVMESGIGAQLSAWVSLLIASIIIRVISLAITTIITARFIELYVYLAIAPIPFTTFCYGEMHSIGLNFLKSFSAVCLQGALLYLIMGFFPLLSQSIGATGDLVGSAWGMVGITFVLAVAVFMCGRWAKSIMHAA